MFGLFDNTQPQRSSREASDLDDLEDDLPDIDSIELEDWTGYAEKWLAEIDEEGEDELNLDDSDALDVDFEEL